MENLRGYRCPGTPIAISSTIELGSQKNETSSEAWWIHGLVMDMVHKTLKEKFGLE
jgi:hypothetical protein